jgi:predicted kinase
MYVVVSGLPGSGKSTVARPLAATLALPLLARDAIKESLWDSLGGGDIAWSRKLGAASAETFWRLAHDANGAAVLDNFVHRAFAHRLESLPGPFVEVHCACPPELARDRYLNRQRHPCHYDLTYGAEMYDQWLRTDAGPLALGPVLSVDTSDVVDIGVIAAWVRAADS